MIYILDEIRVQPGMVAAYEAAYRETYFPLAQARAMTLQNAWMTPPAVMPDKPNTLMFLWTVPDEPAWWRMRYGAFNPEIAAFWEGTAHMVQERRRVFLGPQPSEIATDA